MVSLLCVIELFLKFWTSVEYISILAIRTPGVNAMNICAAIAKCVNAASQHVPEKHADCNILIKTAL